MARDTLAARQEHDQQVPVGPPNRRRLSVMQRLLKGWAQLAVSVICRRVDVVQTAGAAADGPAILAVNHTNALGDPVMILAKNPGVPRFLAAASWWKFAPAR